MWKSKTKLLIFIIHKSSLPIYSNHRKLSSLFFFLLYCLSRGIPPPHSYLSWKKSYPGSVCTYLNQISFLSLFIKVKTQNCLFSFLLLPLFFHIKIHTGEFTERVREMSSQLFFALYIYPSAHKQLTRHLPDPFRELPSSILGKKSFRHKGEINMSIIT